MIEFKQIIGRGTRLFDGKDYFTIYDFVRAYEHFNDPEWDGEPVEPVPPRPRGEGEEPTPPGGDEGDTQPEGGEEEPPARQKIKITGKPARLYRKDYRRESSVRHRGGAE